VYEKDVIADIYVRVRLQPDSVTADEQALLDNYMAEPWFPKVKGWLDNEIRAIEDAPHFEEAERILGMPIHEAWRLGITKERPSTIVKNYRSRDAAPTRRPTRVNCPAPAVRTRGASRERRSRPGASSRSSSRGPDADPPPPLTLRERRALRLLVDRAVRQRLASFRECRGCGLELPVDAFRTHRHICLRCESQARSARRLEARPT
jgi:hypothetical protein